MKIKRSFSVLIFCVSLCTLLSGCIFGGSIDSLLSPPKLGEKQELIYTALKNYTGSEMELEYPKSGNNLSAFILGDLDDDDNDEALVFYRLKSEENSENELHMNVLDQTDGKWRSVYDAKADGNELDKIEISHLGSLEKTEIIVGYILPNISEKAFYIYSYSDEALDTSFENEPYSYFETADLDSDGETELLSISSQSASKIASAVVYSPGKEGTFKSSSTALDESYIGYKNIKLKSKDGGTYIYIDAQTAGGNVVTDLLFCDGEEQLSQKRLNRSTARPAQYLTDDIDGDGTPEIPVPHICPGYDGLSGEPVYFTSWYTVSDSGAVIPEYESLYSLTSGYYFLIPNEWRGRVTAKRDIEKNSVTLGYGDDPETAKEIFTLLTVSEKEKDDAQKEGYTLLHSGYGKYYYIKYNRENSLYTTDASLISRFRFKS